MIIITVANQKGGIGKTTTATAMASVLQSKGYKVLLIDTDMQCNSTDAYKAQTDQVATLYDVLLAEEKTSINDAIQHTESGDIIASDRLLLEADDKLKSDSEGVYLLQDALSELNGYDYVILDTNPTLNHMLYNCLVASNEIVVPMTADRFGVTGLQQLSQTVTKIKRRQNPNLRVAGLLLVKFKERTRLGRDIRDFLTEAATNMDTEVFETTIRESVKIQEAQAARISIMDYAPKSTSALDYISFIDELIEKEKSWYGTK